MPDVTPCLHPGVVRRWVSFDQYKFSIVAAVLPPDGGKPEVCRIETTEKAIRRFIDKQGGPAGLSVCYEAGPGGFALWRLLTKIGVAYDVVAPSLIPVRAGDRVKTDRRRPNGQGSLDAQPWSGSRSEVRSGIKRRTPPC
jgi:hypothetical protein